MALRLPGVALLIPALAVAPVLHRPSETDLYFPVSDARYEARFIRHVTPTPIP